MFENGYSTNSLDHADGIEIDFDFRKKLLSFKFRHGFSAF
jgi:hypothetical protein